MTDTYRALLRLAADGGLPRSVDATAGMSMPALADLVEAGHLRAIRYRTLDGDLFADPEITLAGREYLQTLERGDSIDSDIPVDAPRRRGISIDGVALRELRQKAR